MSDEHDYKRESGVWPPPPAVYGDLTGPTTIEVNSYGRRGKATVIQVLGVGYGIILIAEDAVRHANVGSAAALTFTIVAFARFCFYCALGIVFLTWIYAIHCEIEMTEPGELPVKPGWAVAWYLIPFVCLYKPVTSMLEAWRLSGPKTGLRLQHDVEDGPKTRIILWWITFLIMSALSSLQSIQGTLHDVSLMGPNPVVDIHCLFAIAGLIQMAAIVRGMNARLDEKEAILRQAASPSQGR